MGDRADEAAIGHGLTAKRLRRLVERCRVTDGDGFRLRDHDPADTGGLDLGKADGTELLGEGTRRLADLQERLWARREWAVLCVIQATDTGGKDGTIRHVMSGVNPQGVEVVPFAAPGPEEYAHDFLWRIHRAVPARGRIGIFNRSHYEEVLVPRVHPDVLARQHLPAAVRGRHFWRDRLRDIAAFERYLANQGIAVVKLFLNVSREEQRQRLLARLEEPDKLWKFDPADLAERQHWDEYRHAYERAIAATAAPHAPWYVVPADRKWLAHLVAAEILIEVLEGLDLSTPAPSPEVADAAAAMQRQLESEREA